jgi:hypothetical protein
LSETFRRVGKPEFEKRVDEEKISNIEAIALMDRSFTHAESSKVKAPATCSHAVLLGVQREAIERALKSPAKETAEAISGEKPAKHRPKEKKLRTHPSLQILDPLFPAAI